VAPIEMRQWLPLFTLDHLKAGIQPLKQQVAPGVWELYAPPTLQFRCREVIYVNGTKTTEWGPWVDTGFERESPPGAPE